MRELSRVFGVTFALWATAACQSGMQQGESDEGEEHDLQAILRDGDLGGRTVGLAAEHPVAIRSEVGRFPSDPAIFGEWLFDDCNSFRTDLQDSSGNGHTAFRAVAVSCGTGITGESVKLAQKEDLVYAPDQPQFTFENGVTVAGWFKPTAVGGLRTLFRKRDKGTSAFALVLNGGKFQFVIDLGGGRAISVQAPKKAKANVFQHVAATYDNQVLRLYVDGVEVNNFPLAGAIPPGAGPVLMGNDGSERRFDGDIDETLFAGRALTADEVGNLNCISQPLTLELTPQISDPVPAGQTTTFDVAIANHNPAICGPVNVTVQDNIDFPATIDPTFTTLTVASGTTDHVTLTAGTDGDTSPGQFGISLFAQDDQNDFLQAFATLVTTDPVGCFVSTRRALFITDVSVVDDPVRTAGGGAWSFQRFMETIAPTPEAAPDMVEAMLQTFTVDQTINGFPVFARPNIQQNVLDAWPRTADGKLDLAQAPLRLQAVVDRFDLRDLSRGNAGEGRFVFAFNNPFFAASPLQATMILEFKLPASTEDEVTAWAQRFQALGTLHFSEDYNVALQAITDAFATRATFSALRTNEIDFGQTGLWEMRQFALAADTGLLTPAGLDQTPDFGFSGSQLLTNYVNENASAILTDRHIVPASFEGTAFQAGSIVNTGFPAWFVSNANDEVRFHFALNTCNGCHSSETNGSFTQVFPRFQGSEAGLSGFLTGTTVFDPQFGTQRTLNDLAHRRADLSAIVCDGNMAALKRGVSFGRVH